MTLPTKQGGTNYNAYTTMCRRCYQVKVERVGSRLCKDCQKVLAQKHANAKLSEARAR